MLQIDKPKKEYGTDEEKKHLVISEESSHSNKDETVV